MSVKNWGVTVDCGRCEFASSDGRDSFEVTVPIGDIETGIDGTAKLHCSISVGRHEIKLEAWNDTAGHPIRPPAKTQRRLLAALGKLADQRICGNHQICPADVVRVVEELSRR